MSEAIDNDEDHVLNKLQNNPVSIVDDKEDVFVARCYSAHNKLAVSNNIDARLKRIEDSLFNNESEATDNKE